MDPTTAAPKLGRVAVLGGGNAAWGNYQCRLFDILLGFGSSITGASCDEAKSVLSLEVRGLVALLRYAVALPIACDIVES